MTRRIAWIIGGPTAVVALFAVAAGAVYFIYYSDWPGGMRPSYAATDYDPRLTAEAKLALPIVRAITAHYALSGSYPANVAPLRKSLPKSRFTSAGPCGEVDGWAYYTGPGVSGFTLSRKLGWDPSLVYTWDGATGSWTFDPGDGSPPKTIALRP